MVAFRSQIALFEVDAVELVLGGGKSELKKRVVDLNFVSLDLNLIMLGHLVDENGFVEWLL